MEIVCDAVAEQLLAPVRGVVDRAALKLPPGRPLDVCVGPTDQLAEHYDGRLMLSDQLLGPSIYHPLEQGPLPPMDRWRRAASLVLEAAAIHGIEEKVCCASTDDWRWIGLAMDMVSTVAPSLHNTAEGIALAIETGFPGGYPRAGAAVMRALRTRGEDPWARITHVLRGEGVISPSEWHGIGSWVFDPRGAAALLPVPVQRVGTIDIPCAIDPWRWQPLRVEAHRRGGRVEVEGPGEVGEPWAVAGVEHRTLAAATSDIVRLLPNSGGPTGRWRVMSAEGFGQVMGARGISFEFSPKGGLQLTFADAFVGPLAAVKMAEEVGTSGVARGKWSVAGPFSMRFAKIDTSQLTLHGRHQNAFMMPSRGFGIAAWLDALEQCPWGWVVHQDRLTLRGQMLGGWVDVRLKRALRQPIR